MSSTFGSFGVARLGIYAAQKGLDVTGNNITNINTPGYTRQRLDQVSLISSVSDKYFNQNMTRVGQGVLTTGVSQLRDPGLDLIYREAQADLGASGGKLEGLNSLASILDEVGKGDGEQDDGVILSQLNDLRDLISKAVTNGIQGYDSLIRESASALCTYLNSTAKKLENLQGTYETYLDQDIQKVNDILKNIQDLNTSIRDADIRGDDALELRDSRNMLLDELSQYMDIDVKYTMEDLGAGFMVGSPGQTWEHLAEDLVFLQELQPQMVGIGPFIPHHDTKFAKEEAGSVDLTLKLLSVLRLLLPKVLLPATTALGTLDPLGREKGLSAGANVVMPNLSPVENRKQYELYDNKICTGDEAAKCKNCLSARVRSAGYELVEDRGDYIG